MQCHLLRDRNGPRSLTAIRDVMGAKHDNARSGAGDVHSQVGKSGSAVVVASSDARDVRTIETDIGQFTIAELGQLRNVALILTERLNHADEREQHVKSPSGSRFSSWSERHR